METVVLESEPAGKMRLILGATKCKRFRIRFVDVCWPDESKAPCGAYP